MQHIQLLRPARVAGRLGPRAPRFQGTPRARGRSGQRGQNLSGSARFGPGLCQDRDTAQDEERGKLLPPAGEGFWGGSTPGVGGHRWPGQRGPGKLRSSPELGSILVIPGGFAGTVGGLAAALRGGGETGETPSRGETGLRPSRTQQRLGERVQGSGPHQGPAEQRGETCPRHSLCPSPGTHSSTVPSWGN